MPSALGGGMCKGVIILFLKRKFEYNRVSIKPIQVKKAMKSYSIRRRRETFVRHPYRVLARYFRPSEASRVKNIINRILTLSEEECRVLLYSIIEDFEYRHNDVRNVFKKHYLQSQDFIPKQAKLSEERKLLIGSFFTREYSIEAAALFNPSIVPHPDQKGLSSGELRFILSLRATGEGHISSIVFRSGIIDSKNRLILDPVRPFVELPNIEFAPYYPKELFERRLQELNVDDIIHNLIFADLPDEFTFEKLNNRLNDFKNYRLPSHTLNETISLIDWIAHSNYQLIFRPKTDISERVIFPVSRLRSNGIEDARFVQFDDDGEMTYFATYTSFAGHTIVPMLLETKDFLAFKMRTLNGYAARGKGMALFPRKINGLYTMVSRQDGENLFLMQSDDIYLWNETKKLYGPRYKWEFIQVGNCGSPIETEAGWLLLTHGVGSVREYAIGAILLDLDDPSKVIGSLKKPLLEPNEVEREGYVPNVVYTCGALVHNGMLIMPYASSDTSSGIASIRLNELLEMLLDS